MNLDETKNLIKEGIFYSPSKGRLDLGSIVNELINYKKEDTDVKYKVVIGTDSEQRNKGTEFVCVVAIHRIGKGGRYFWLKIFDDKKTDLRTRIYKEATISLALAGALLEKELELSNVNVDMSQSLNEIFKSLNGSNKGIVFSNDLEIHVDIGLNGPTKAMIKEIVGMIKGSGFFVRIKPEAFAAANIADKHL